MGRHDASVSGYLPESLAATYGVVKTGDALANGLTRQDLRKLAARDWWRFGQGVFLTQPRANCEPDQRAAAALALAGSGAVVSHATAARVHGFSGLDGLPGFDQRDPVEAEHVSLDRRSGGRVPVGLIVHRVTLNSRDVVTGEGLRITSAVRTAADLLLCESRAAAVVAIDSAIQRGCLPMDAAPEIARRLARRHGAPRARRHLELVDGRAESPLETLSRLHFIDQGLAPTALQFEVRGPNDLLVGRADFLFEEPGGRRVLGEADGRDIHDHVGARHRDLSREESLRDLGFDIVRWTWADLLGRGPTPASRVRRALARHAA